MKKICTMCMLVILLFGNLQVGLISSTYANNLATQKEKNIQALDKVGVVLDTAMAQLDTKINDDRDANIQEKQEEIEQYLEEAKQKISQENSSGDIKAISQETKKVVILKVVSAVTHYEDLEDNISHDVADTPQEIEQALDTIQDSLQTSSGDYSIIVKTQYNISKLQSLFAKFDDSTQVEHMYLLDGENYYEVFLESDSIFRQEMLEDIESGILPETFLGAEIVLPEVFSISTIQEPSSSILTGENLSQTWGIEHYQSYKYFPKIGENSKKIRVAVIDTGIDYTHPDLKNNVNQTLGKDFVNQDDDAMDDQGHGTHVAGTIAANINGSGIIGVNPYVELIPLKICTDRGFCPSYAVIRALEYAKEQKIDILNMSLGGRGNPTDHAICDGIRSVTNAGGIVVAASGNSNIDTSRFVPGGCGSAITVGAYDASQTRAVFSNYGDKVDVSAPGVNVYSSYPVNKGSYKQLSGTSMATPHVVGLVSIIQAYDPDISTNGVKKILKQYSLSLNTSSGKSIGAGVDMPALVQALSTPVLAEKPVPEQEEINSEQEKEVATTQTGATEPESGEGKNTDTIVLEAISDTSVVSIATLPDAPEEVVEDEEVISVSNIESTTIDFGDSGVEINSVGSFTGSIETDDIDTSVEAEKIFYDVVEEQIFDVEGNDISDQVEINSNETFTSFEGTALGADDDISTILSQSGSGTIILDETDIGDEDQEEDAVWMEPKEVLIDTAERGVEINSADIGEGEVFEFSTGSLDSSEVFLDEEGNEIDISQLEILAPDQEVLDYSYDEEILIDGAQRGVEINSAEDSFEEIEVPLYNPLLHDISPTLTHGEDIIGYNDEEAGVEINSLDSSIDGDAQIFEAVLPVEEELVATLYEPLQFEAPSDLDIPQGVEINSSDEKQELTLDIISVEDLQNLVIDDLPELELIGAPELEEEGGVEINSAQDDEITTIIPELESIETPIYDPADFEAISLDIAGDFNESEGLEINSLGSDESQEIAEIIESEQDLAGSVPVEKNGGEIETPEEFLNDPDFQDNENDTPEDEIIYAEVEVYNPENDSSETDGFGASIQNTYHCTVTLGQSCSYRIYKGYRYNVSADNSSIARFGASKRYSYFTGLREGTTTYRMYRYGRLYHTIYITVKPRPKSVTHNVKVEQYKYVNISIPNANRYRYSVSHRRNISIGTTSNYAQIRGNRTGNVIVYIRDYYGHHMGTIHVQVVPKQPPIYNKTLIEGQTLPNYLRYANRYQFSQNTGGIIGVSANSRYFYLRGMKPGNGQIYVKYYGRHLYTLDITVKEKPKPKIYELSVQEGKQNQIYIPSARYYGYRGSGQGTTSIWTRGNSVYVQGNVAGKQDMYVTYRGQHIATIKINVTPKPPVEMNISLLPGEAKSHRLNWARYHAVSMSNTSIAKLSSNNYYFQVQATKPGNTKIYLKYAGIHRYTLNVTVIAPPPPQVYDVEILEGKGTNVFLPQLSGGSYRYVQVSATGKVYFYTNSNHARMHGYLQGKNSYYVYDHKNIHRYTFNVVIKLQPPQIVKHEVYETKRLRLFMGRYDRLTITDPSMLQVRGYGSYKYFTGLKQGMVEIYVKDQYGRHTQTIEMTIKAPPEPKIYTLDLYARQGAYVQFPKDVSRYRVVSTGDTKIFSQTRMYRNNRMYIRVQGDGKSSIEYIGDNGFPEYRIDVSSKVYRQKYTVHLSENKRISVRHDDRVYYQHGARIAYVDKGRPDYLVGRSLGTTEIKVEDDDGGLYLILDVTVVPKPEPREVTCDTEIGKKCRFKFSNRGYYYTESRSGIADIDTGKTSFRIKGKSSGTIKVYVKHKYADYISHIITVNVAPLPVRQYTCSTPVGVACDTNWSGEKYEYRYTMSQSGITQLSLDYYRIGSRRYNKLRLTGLKPGTVDVYVYNAYDHIATFTITVEAPVSRISLGNQGGSIHQGETRVIDILDGGTQYKSLNTHDSNIASVSTRNDEGRTGRIKITGKNPGRTSVSVKDKYGQQVRFGVTIRDTVLRLSTSRLELKGSQEFAYVSIGESHGSISAMKIGDSSIARAYLTYYGEENTPVIKVFPKSTGSTVLELTDEGGNKATVDIIVGGGKNEEVKEEESGNEGTSGEDFSEFEKELEKLFQDFDFGSGVKINSLETENGKKQAIIDGNFSSDLIARLDNMLNSFKGSLDKKSTDPIKKILTLQEANKKFNALKIKQPELDHIISYIIFTLEGWIEEYRLQSFRGKTTNPFDKYYSTQFLILNRQVEMNIELKLVQKSLSSKYVKETYGGIFSKEGLSFLLQHQIISQKEYDTYMVYTPEIDSLMNVLEEEGSMDKLLIHYFPEEKGAQDGMKQAIKDYLAQNIDVLDPRDIPDLLAGVYTGLKQVLTGTFDVSKVTESAKEVYELFKNIDEIVAGLDTYKQYYYKSYLSTTLSFAIIPIKYGAVAKKAKGGGDSKVIETLKNRNKIVNNPDVKSTIERIKKGEKKYKQDGTIFANDARSGGEKLPTKGADYYSEWTVETPGLSHRGQKRIVLGKNGEQYFTDNHYGTFIKIK